MLEIIVIVVVLLVGYLFYIASNQKVELYFHRSKETLAILNNCDTIYSKPEKVESNGATTSQARYKPPFFLFNTHMHVVWGAFVRKYIDLKYKRDLIRTEDGGTLSVDWFTWEDKDFDQNTPTVVILHGLTGGSYERYVQHLAQHAYEAYGWRTVVCNYRGCANTEVTTWRSYCAANTEDFRFSLSHIQKKIPNAPLFVAGFSLGSILCVKYLSETAREVDSGKKGNPFIAAASISNPMDLIKSTENLNLFWNRHIY
eukprot:TRINITY_DN13731_c0_g1_i1.p1 TRINITY_DN13731_c0_g1~~TRINITY_DN13731_c0_g1_i1.p1  ORF type:complete len:257 (-),score=35.06 TRINITY_DN13731_c0_g1_i1:108-878(-)